MPERVKKSKCRGGVLRKKIEGGGMSEMGKEDKMRGGGVAKKNIERGMP